ncbi:MAG: hemerythrin domain-containing protein, partial [Alphaproteobacteria bacterium]
RDAAAAEAVGDLAAEHAGLAARTRKLANAVTRVIGEETVERASVHALAEDLARAYRRHIAFEEERFFPAAEASLTEADWAEIDARLDAPDDPLFGERVAARFRDLREDIDSLVRVARKA